MVSISLFSKTFIPKDGRKTFANLNRGCASKSKNPGKMVVMDFVTNMFKHLNLDVKKGPTPYLGLTQPLGAVLRT